MNRLMIAAAFAACTVAPVVAQDGKPVEPPKPVVDCEARKFETSVEFEKDDQKRQTKLTICPAKGEGQATWAKTLRDAKAKIVGHPHITEESKAKISAELDAEITRAESLKAGTIELPDAPIPPATRPPEYGAYPPLPAPPPAAKATLTAPPPVAAKPTLAASPPARPVQKPRLTIRCLASGESGAGSPCFTLARSTRLAIRADEQLGRNISLRFLRKGETRGEIALAGMRQGQLMRSNLPAELCRNVATSQVEIQVLNTNQVTETLGPYKLRC